MKDKLDKNTFIKKLFGDYMQLTGTPSLSFGNDAHLPYYGKKIGVVNGSNWVSLWSTYFGQKALPGAKIINVGNEAVQLNFMEAHHRGESVPPQINIDLFCRYAQELYDLYKVDAVLISCSTMNRAFNDVKRHMAPMGVPVIQIDEAMMEKAVAMDGKILVIATHGPTVKSTQELLLETANRFGKSVSFVGATVENAFELLGAGKITEHNEAIANAIYEAQRKEKIDVVVLAQLSMSVFSFDHPYPEKSLGVKVLNSGETGFRRVAKLMRSSITDLI